MHKTVEVSVNGMHGLITLLVSQRHFIKQVRHLRFLLPFHSTAINSFEHPSQSRFIEQENKTQLDLCPAQFSEIAKSAISKCSHLFEKTKVRTCADSSLKALLFEIFDVIPDTARRFLRVSLLEPEHVLQILLEFRCKHKKGDVGVGKIKSLWEIFKWGLEQAEDYKPLPQACEVMASMLTRVGLLGEVEFLLSMAESRGLSLVSPEIFSNLIEEFALISEVDRSLLLYDHIKRQGLVPSLSCYHVLVDLFVQKRNTKLANAICLDMITLDGIDVGDQAKRDVENVITLLFRDGEVQEARNLLKKFTVFRWEPSQLVMNEIVRGYCEKRDFNDLLSLFVDLKYAPDAEVGNRIIHTICKHFGSECANLFRLKLEDIAFRPDEITFGILIGWSCYEGNLKSSLVYYSEALSRELKPDKHTYNSLISGVFKKGMWRNAQYIFDEMMDHGVKPDLSTYRVLLAGYCKARQFDEVKRKIGEMVKLNMIQLSSYEDPLSKAFMMLGFSPLAVMLKRDGSVGFSRTEFFDKLGNGLYLDTDTVEFDRRVNSILEESLIPDFNSFVIKECSCGNSRYALRLVNEMARWGQELSSFDAIVKGLCESRSSPKTLNLLFEKMAISIDQLNEETLNLLVQFYTKRCMGQHARTTMSTMLERGLTVTNDTISAFITDLSKRGNSGEFHAFLDLMSKHKLFPRMDDFKSLVENLCQKHLLYEVVELCEGMLFLYPLIKICDVLLGVLCAMGYTPIADVLVKKIHDKGFTLDDNAAYQHIIEGFCRENDNDGPLKIFDAMQTKRIVPCPEVTVLLIPRLCLAGRFDEANALKGIALREHPSLSLSINCALLEGYCRSGNVIEAANLFWNFLIDGNGLLDESFGMMVKGICQSNNLQKVMELLSLVIRRDLSLSVDNFRRIVRLMCKEGQPLHALNLHRLMLAQSSSHGLVVYNILIFYFLLTGKTRLVLEILEQLKKRNLRPDEVTYNFLVYGFACCKEFSSSLHYLSILISKDLKPRCYSLRSISRCLIGAEPDVKQMVQEINKKGLLQNTKVRISIIRSLIFHGRFHEAELFVDQIAKGFLIPSNVVYDSMIKWLCSQRKMRKAIHLLNIMLTKGNIPDSSCYDYIIHGLCTSNQLDDALDIHAEMLGRYLKPSIKSWGILIEKCCDIKRIAEAERLLNSMILVGETPTKGIYNSIISRYRLEGNLRKASELVHSMQQVGYEPDFDTHWSLISTLSNPKDKEDSSSKNGFLSRLLHQSGL